MASSRTRLFPAASISFGGAFASGFPPVHASISDDALLMSYGEPDAPILELAPIPLTEIVFRGT
jgi:hypothetical protein